MKIITICGSLKYQDVMVKKNIDLSLQGNIVLMPILPCNDKEYTKEEIVKLGKIHLEKIKISDAIYVVNVNKYVGDGTKKEIEYAKNLNKEVIYLEEV